MGKDGLVNPIVKWVGGKRQLLPEIKKHIPQGFTRYYEPFLGGGAVLFALQPQEAVVNDVNEELINVYQVVKQQVDTLILDLQKHKNESGYYYRIRELDRDSATYNKLSAVERASRILYLNKTCYNGLFRVNRKGQFNAPFGSYNKPNIVNAKTLKAVSRYLNAVQITFKCGDFADALQGICDESFVYFDPPYDPISTSANFTEYAKKGFGRKEQLRLKEACDDLTLQQVKFLLSNSASDFIFELYKDYQIDVVQAKRVINSLGNKRGAVREVLIKNYD